MKAPITAAQAMQHPTVAETINTLSQLAEKLRSERDALLDRLEKSEKDAERYRWLRERHDESDTQWHVRGHFGSPVLSGQLDTSIDSAMEASK